MKAEKIITKNGKKIRIRPEQIHTRKLDRIAAKYTMRHSGRRRIFKSAEFSSCWRDYVPE